MKIGYVRVSKQEALQIDVRDARLIVRNGLLTRLLAQKPHVKDSTKH